MLGFYFLSVCVHSYALQLPLSVFSFLPVAGDQIQLRVCCVDALLWAVLSAHTKITRCSTHSPPYSSFNSTWTQRTEEIFRKQSTNLDPSGTSWGSVMLKTFSCTFPHRATAERNSESTVVTPTCSKIAHCQQGYVCKHRAYSIYSTVYHTSAWLPRSTPLL